MLEPELTSLEEWTSVLKLSNMWHFTELRQEAIEKLSKIPLESLEEVLLARVYNGYAEFVERDTMLSDEEKKTLESHATIKIYKLREDTYKRGTYDRYYGSCRDLEGAEARVSNTFSEELADIQFHQKRYEEVVETVDDETENDVRPNALTINSAKKLSCRKKGKKLK